MVKVLRDKSANLKKLRVLEKKGLIEIHEVDLENLPKYAKNVDLPLAVWDQVNWDHAVWADSNEKTFDDIKAILGVTNIKDVISLESAVRYKCDYFVTEDLDEFIGRDGERRETLQRITTGVKIVTTEELEKLLD